VKPDRYGGESGSGVQATMCTHVPANRSSGAWGSLDRVLGRQNIRTGFDTTGAFRGLDARSSLVASVFRRQDFWYRSNDRYKSLPHGEQLNL
jgi:hypothetical protein